MSYPLDIAAQNAALDALLGDGAAASMPSSFEVALFNGDPSGSGTELTSTGGYARVTVANDTAHWPAAVSGAKTGVPVVFADATADWSDAATHFLMYDAADSTTAYFYGSLADVLVVVDGQTDNQIEPAIYWNTLGA